MTLKECLEDPTKRARVRALLEINPWWNLKIVAVFALWIVGGYMTLNTPYLPLRIVGYVVMGMSLHSMAIFTHEATHGILFRNKSLNRAIGFLTGAPAFISVTSYRVVHMVHHAHTGDEKDPDEFTNAVPNPALRRIAFFMWLLVGGPYYIFIHVPIQAWRLGTRSERRDIIVEYALLLIIYGGTIGYLVSIGRFDIFIHCWIVPVLVAMIFVNVRGVAEHMMTAKEDDFTSTRTVLSNRLVRFFMNNLNYHLEHHLIPNVPWYRLPELHEILKPDMEAAHSPVGRSYLKFIWKALKEGGKE